MLFMGAGLVAVPEAVRALTRSLRPLVQLSSVASLVLVAVSAAWGALIMAVPESIGHFVLGEAWIAACAFLPAAIIGRWG